MKRNSDLRNTWYSCVMQMLKRQTLVKGAVFCNRLDQAILQLCLFYDFDKLLSYLPENNSLLFLLDFKVLKLISKWSSEVDLCFVVP